MNKGQARDVALEVLVQVERKQSYSNIELNHALRQTNLSRVDVALVTELVYGVLQRQNTLDWLLSPFVRKGLHKLELWVRELLRMSVYQLNYLHKIPPGAAVHEAVNIAKRRGHRKVAAFVNAVLRNVQRQKEKNPIRHGRNPVKKLALQHSHPEWLVARWLKAWDEQKVVRLCEANNRPPPHTIRVNPLKMSRSELKEALQAQRPEATVRESEVAAQGLIVEGFGNMGDRSWYHEGIYSIQDESSMLVSEVLSPSPGASVLDMCAAPGGKATHIAELMNDEGRVDAYDIHEHRVNLITQQARRLGLHCLTAQQADARQLSSSVVSQYDYVLLDAPCSGFGVIHRKPEIKWRRTEVDIEHLVALQRQLLDAAATLVRPGGVLVYSTCTLDPRENEHQITSFLERQPAFAQDLQLPHLLSETVSAKGRIDAGMLRIFPQDFHSDGFFITRLVRHE